MKQYESSVTSQWGEDGVIAEIFRRIGTKNKVCVEVGAWDGEHFSNTYALREQGWTGVLAEADPERAKLIKRQPGVEVFGQVLHIDSMLDAYEIQKDFDLLSIDVDGDDFYLWQDMKRYRPRVVVIEYNNTVPPHIGIVQQRGGQFGASYEALCEIGACKGYGLAHITMTNMIFVWLDDWEILTPLIGRTTPDVPTDWLQYCVTGYNGKKYIIGSSAHNDNQGGVHEELITNVTYEPLILGQ